MSKIHPGARRSSNRSTDRGRRRFVFSLGLLAGLALAGCRGESDGSLSNSANGQDGGVCTRDLVAINDLLAHPVACVSDAQCPQGAFCDPARGACDFQCVTDSACGPAGICGCDGRCTGGTGPGPTGGSTCERSKELLQSASARSCTATTQCPQGMACDAIAHTCEVAATCTTDVGCPVGAACSQSAGPAYHTCLARTCAADADCPSGIACDGASHLCLIHAPRACVFDEQCPNGARCDEATRQCRNDCGSDADCTAGTACDCLGQCVAPGTVPAMATDHSVHLEVSPAQSPVVKTAAATAWAPRRLAAYLQAPSAATAQTAKDVDVTVRPSTGLLVACGSETLPPASAYSTHCTLATGWTFSASGTAQLARQYVWVKPASADILGGDVQFTSDGVTGSPAVASFAGATPTGLVPPPAPVPTAGEYAGTLTPMGTNWNTISATGALSVRPDASAATLAAAVPVRAWEVDGTSGEMILDFYDATRMLADTGKLRASSAKFTYVDWMAAIDDFAPANATPNVYRAKSLLVGKSFDTATGMLRGVLVIIPRQGGDPLGFQFTLKRVGAAVTCAAGCSAGLTCATDLGVCEAGVPWTNGAVYDGATPLGFTDSAAQRWVAWLAAVGAVGKAADSTFCYTRPCAMSNPTAKGYDGAGASMCPFGSFSKNPDNTIAYWPNTLDPNLRGSVSADLLCSYGKSSVGADLLYDVDRVQLGEAAMATSTLDMLDSCRSDLLIQPPTVPASTPLASALVNATSLYDQAWTHKKCFTPAPFFAALTRVALPAGSTSATIQGNKFSNHLLAQWLAIHGFLAKEGVQERRMADVVGQAADADASEHGAVSQVPERAEILREMERGWDLVFADPEMNTIINGTYVTPDYRPNGGTGEQTVGLPVQVLETAALHLDATTELLRFARLATYAECHTTGSSTERDRALRTAGRALRYAAHAESAAAWAYERTTGRYPKLTTSSQQTALCTAAAGAPPAVPFPFCALDLTKTALVSIPWQARFDAALAQYQAARQRATQAATDLSACENPVGVNEAAPGDAPLVNGIPLYFGDVSGTSSRFFASSDYLLNGWAQPAVEHAKASLDAARAAWAEKRNSEIQQVLTDQEVTRRGEAISSGYGQQLVDLCGLEGVPATSALSRFTGASALLPETCFIRDPSAECARYVDDALNGVPSPAAKDLAWPPSQVAPELPPSGHCFSGDATQSDLRVSLCVANEFSSRMHVQDPKLKTFAAGFLSATTTPYRQCPNNVALITSNAITMPISDAGYLLTIDQSQRPSGAEMAAKRAICQDMVKGVVDDLPYSPDAESYASCFRGQLGEQILGVMGARKTVGHALMDWSDAQREYDIEASACIHKAEWQADTAALAATHAEYMGDLATARAAAGAFVALGAAVAGGGPLGLVALGASIAFDNAAQDAERRFQEEMTMTRDRQELYDCYGAARKAKLRIDNAANAIEGAIASADQHMVAFSDLQTKVRNAVADGNGALAREDGRKVPPIAFHYWLDEKVDRFHKDFEWAKQLTYLSMLAVEYEYQQSLGLRSEILRATNPDQLSDAIRVMQQTQLSRTIDGKRPEAAHLVRSLVSDVLKLDDQDSARAGERHWTKAERFQHRVLSPEYAQYDDHGVYLGQGIPFSLEPDGELTYSCAEKLWQVTATIQGDGLSNLAPSAPVMLLKRNQFSSQWCSGQGDSSSMQTASAQPPSRLFPVDQRGGSEAAVPQLVTAHVTPWFNVPRTEFYRDAYAEGASQELAGRGLYGGYILLFPAEGLLRAGFPLAKVEDVLLRFDYLSVDNLHVTTRATGDAADPTVDTDRAGASE